jgi:uncharacterized coiled-coil protein SlyX
VEDMPKIMITKKCHDVVRKIKKKKTKKKKDLTVYMAAAFLPPQNKNSSEMSLLKQENRALKRSIESLNCKMESQEITLQALNEKLNQQLGECHALQDQLMQCLNQKDEANDLRVKLEEKRVLLDQTLLDYSKLQAAQPALQVKKSKLDYRDGQIKSLKKKLAISEEENKNMFQELLVTVTEDDIPAEDQIEELNGKVKDLSTKYELLKEEIKKKKRKLNDQDKKLDECMSESKKHKKVVNELKEEIDQLQDTIEYLESDEVKTFENGRYTDELRDCVMTLVTNGNVSLRKIPEVISCVLSKLVGKLPKRLPSPSLISSRIMLEAKYIANNQVCGKYSYIFFIITFVILQIADAMLRDFEPQANTGNTLSQDSTTKFHDHYEGMQVSSSI